MAVTTPFQVRIPRSRITCGVADSFQTLFAVPMTCESCVRDVSGSLFKLSGIQKVEANLKDQLVSIEGTGADTHTGTSDTDSLTFISAAPSAIVAAIQSTGRDAILRGSGGSNGKLQVSV